MEKVKGGKTARNIIKVAFSNILKMLSGVLIGFLLPKIIGVSDFGYYKTFTLYASYVILLSFGFSEGLLLLHGGKDYEELKKEDFRLYSRFFIVLELIFALIGVGISFVFQGEVRFIFAATSIHLFSLNLIAYYQNISQMTSRFNELSVRNIVLSALSAASVIFVYLLGKFAFDNPNLIYHIFVICYLVVHFLVAAFYAFSYRDLLLGAAASFKERKKELLVICRTGLPLLISNLVSTLILSCDRQFVNVLYDTDTYAIYSFAYSMFSLFTTATTAVSTVIYPSLKKRDPEHLFEDYDRFVALMLVFVFVAIALFFPLCWFIGWFLPNYVDSIPIFRVIIPGLAINSGVTIIIHNYYKASKESPVFFVQCLIVLALSVVANLIAHFAFHTTISISIASVIVVVIWYLLAELYCFKKHKTRFVRNLVYSLLMLAGFYLCSFINPWWLGLIVYFPASFVVSALIYFDETKRLFGRFRKTKREEPAE